MDVDAKWAAIVRKHAEAERREMQDLLEEMARYLGSQGLILDLKRSYLGKDDHASDGARMSGELTVMEDPQNNIKAETEDMIRKWVQEGTGLYGSVRKLSEGPQKRQVDDLPVGHWTVDISSY